ncbi:MAG TPA: hypothetical protein VE076_00375 [Nitrososphaeraceae archaeon]|nr:hypothetical protein [Nitrososphaeraceae archaeon]
MAKSNILKDGGGLLINAGANDTSYYIKRKLNVQELSPLTETNKASPSTSDHPLLKRQEKVKITTLVPRLMRYLTLKLTTALIQMTVAISTGMI